MYGLWWVVIVFAAMSAIAICVGYAVKTKVNKKVGETLKGISAAFGWGIGIGLTMVWGSLAGLAIYNPVHGKTEFVQKQYEYEALATVAIEYDDFIQTKQFELVSKEIVDRILDYNAWLAEARADKETWGAFSQYIYCDLDSLKFIGE